MIKLYSGTPGSGKSLHLAKDIFNFLKNDKYRLVVSNVPINLDVFKDDEKKRFIYLSNDELEVSRIWEIGEKWYKENEGLKLSKREQCCVLILDECQLLFNSRSWTGNSKKGWPEFFSLHRHAGFYIILAAQMMEALDKQVRGLIEYECLHVKVKNFGAFGAFLNILAFGGLFMYSENWVPKKLKIDNVFFKYHRRYGELYDTHLIFENPKFKGGTNGKSKKNKEDSKNNTGSHVNSDGD